MLLAGSLKPTGRCGEGASRHAADLAAGWLVFAPATNASGNGYAERSFSVKDQYGAFDASPKTLGFNVTLVNDAPTGTVTISVHLTQNW